MDMTGGSKKRRETEVYENYWKFTAAYTNLLGTKFHNCLSVTVMFIDSHKKERKMVRRRSFTADFRKES